MKLPAPNADQLSSPAWSVAGEDTISGAQDATSPTQRYTLLNELGRGGMGQVWVAHDQVLGREVALKLLRPELSQRPDAEARLRKEAEITAILDHPGVVAVHDVGRMPDGRLFYAMRLVRGRSLDAALQACTSPQARLELLRPLLSACEAVGYAHAVGVVHRDLKPSNILIGDFGETQVVDWGLAQRIDAQSSGAGAGTPAYMSPEQAAGGVVDARSDVWSLGATLYELLSGAPPTPNQSTSGRSAALASQISQTLGPDPGSGYVELNAIVRRAMHPDPQHRYPHASALAADLLAWFEGRRVAAHSYTPLELLRRVIDAWRLPLAISAVALLLISAALGLGWRRTQTQRDRAIVAEDRAAQALHQAEQRLGQILAEQATAAVSDDRRAAAEQLAVEALTRLESPEARGALAAFGRTPRPRLVDSHPGPSCAWSSLSERGELLLCGEPDGFSVWNVPEMTLRWRSDQGTMEGWATRDAVIVRAVTGEVTALDSRTQSLLWRDRTGPTSSVRVQVAGTPVHLGGGPLASGEVWRTCAAPGTAVIAAAAASLPRVATLCADGTLALELDGQKVRMQTHFERDDELASLVWTPDGSLLVAGGLRGALHLIDPFAQEVLRTTQSSLGTIRSLRISEDGHLALASGTQGGVGLWALPSGVWLGDLPARLPRSVSFSTEPDTVMVFDGTLRRWNLRGVDRPYRVWIKHGLADLRISPDGGHLALAHPFGFTIVDLLYGASDRFLPLAEAVTKAVDWSPDGTWLVASNVQGQMVTAWRFPELQQLTTLSANIWARRLVVRPDGEVLGTSYTGPLLRWSPPFGATKPRMQLEDKTIIDMESQGGWVVMVADGGQVYRMGPKDPAPAAWARLDGATMVSVSADGQRTVVAAENRVWLLDPAGEILLTLTLTDANLRDLSISPDGMSFAAGGLDGRARVWSADGTLRAVLAGHTERVSTLEYSPDGQWLITGSWDHSARIWDLSVLREPVDRLEQAILGAWGDPQNSGHPE